MNYLVPKIKNNNQRDIFCFLFTKVIITPLTIIKVMPAQVIPSGKASPSNIPMKTE